MAYSNLAYRDDRASARDEVQYRTRATGALGQSLSLLIVNLSAQGLMARCEAPLKEGDRLRITLPVVTAVEAEVRWALGGRIGIQLDRPIDLADYYELLARLLKAR